MRGGKKRDGKTDRHQGDTQRSAGRDGGFEGDDPGCRGDRAKRHQDTDRQRSGVTLGERLEPLRLLRGELAVFYEPGDVENDLDAAPFVRSLKSRGGLRRAFHRDCAAAR